MCEWEWVDGREGERENLKQILHSAQSLTGAPSQDSEIRT